MTYELVIGMETHIELDTDSKMFCTCSANFFGKEPNINTCPTCLGLPGALPTINKRAVEFVIKLGLALHCDINTHTFWERKSYWYPDLPKGYQITQYQYPTAQHGYLDVDVRDLTNGWSDQSYRKRIRIRRAHLEEDVGKLSHVGNSSYVDYNRGGVPLVEIVTEPDITTPDEALAYLGALQSIVRYLGISTGDMEKGAMRCEPNISVRRAGTQDLNTKVEVKNLNSFRVVRDATAYEWKRQVGVLERGEKIRQVTMGWDEALQKTVVQRDKEDAHDYRYFPEPDLPPLVVDETWLNQARTQLPELALARQDRYRELLGISAYDAHVLTQDRAMAEYFEAAVGAHIEHAKGICNMMTGELFRLMRANMLELANVRVKPGQISQLVGLTTANRISSTAAKTVFEEMFATGADPESIVEARGLAQVSDESALRALVVGVLDANPDPVKNYLSGNVKLLQFLVGQTMKASAGKGNPGMIRELVTAELEKRR